MVAPNDCSLCHTTANWNSTACPPATCRTRRTSACSVCHTTAPADYTTTTLAANAVLHTGIASGCITCHGAPNSTPPVFYQNYTPKDAVLSPVHIPTAHDALRGLPRGDGVHELQRHDDELGQAHLHVRVHRQHLRRLPRGDHAALSFYGVNNLTVRPSGHHVGQDCSGCHNTNDWGGDSATRTAAATKSKVMLVVSPPGTTRGAVLGAGGAVAPTAESLRVGGRRVGTPRVAAPGAGMPGVVAPGRAVVMSVPGPTHAGVTGNCASCHNGTLAAGKPRDPHREQQRLRELPHDARLDAGALRSPRRRRTLRQLP